MAIRIERNEQGNCINFHGSSNPTYWNACLSGEVDSVETSTVNVVNDVITSQTGVKEYEFFQIPYTEFVDASGNAFSSAQETAEYITTNANVTGLGGGGTDLSLQTVCFKLDDTSTSIMLDNGYSFGVNTIKALNTGDGLITINSKLGDIKHFTGLDHTNVCDGDGNPISGGLNDVINYLNELFTVGAFEQIVISDPYSTMVADVSGEDTTVSYVGNSIDPIGSDVYGSSSTGAQNGLLTTETIDQAGEYFTFDIRVEGIIGFGLVHTQASYDAGYYSGSSNYADPTSFGVGNSVNYGFQFSHWFHPTPNGSWSNYGANTSASFRSGWYNFTGSQEQSDWLAGNPIKVRVGIDSNSFITIDTLRDGTTWEPHARTSYPVVEGAEFRLGIKTNDTEARVFSLPKVHLLEPAAPTMNFRWIESPDGTFVYPLFTTAEEANYYDEIHNGLTAGTGSSHTHTYADDPTNTTWYMPEASHDPTSYHYSSAPSGTETFSGNTINWTTITSLTNADLTPAAFSGSDYTHQEGTVVNLQLYPAGATFTQSVTISPTSSGLAYNSTSGYLQGTLSDVTTNTVYTVSVTRANSYGSSTGSFTITATDVAPVQTNSTPWTKALDFSGSSEYAKHNNNSRSVNPLKMNDQSVLVPVHSTDSTKTSDNVNSRPWATAIVFDIDNVSQNQHIWNQGEGAGSGDDNIYLRLDSSKQLIFGWGREGVGYNECTIHPTPSAPSGYLGHSAWYGVYIAHKGTRLSGSDATAANLADAFDIRIMNSAGNNWTIGSNLSVAAAWTSTGFRMDRGITGDFTIGGRGTNRSFNGQVASMVVTTLRTDDDMPTSTEIVSMVKDPLGWVDNYKVGSQFRHCTTSYSQYDWDTNGSEYFATQVWLMGDGTNDSYPNGIRNQVRDTDSYTKLALQNMVSNDIETVSINGLT